MAIQIATDLELASPAFRDGESIPARYTCDGENVSPPLMWQPAPRDARSLALIVEDPDAPNRVWAHWAVYNLPPNLTSLAEAVERWDALDNGARQGLNDFGNIGYDGPGAPEAPHRCVFRLFALNSRLYIPPRFSRVELLRAIQGRVLVEGRLVGSYRRRMRY